MEDKEKKLLLELYSIPPQPYSIHLRNIRRILDTGEDAAACLRALDTYLRLAGVPPEEDR